MYAEESDEDWDSDPSPPAALAGALDPAARRSLHPATAEVHPGRPPLPPRQQPEASSASSVQASQASRQAASKALAAPTGGSGTVVTGGRLMRSVGADGVRAATIQGGESRSVVVGDVLIIPAGTPHWYSQIPESVTYLEIRYDPGDE